MTSMQLVKDTEANAKSTPESETASDDRLNVSGQSYIPPSQRPDGTWRKPIRVRDGYVPQEEQPVYVSKGRQTTQDTSGYPVGLSQSDLESFKGNFPVTGYFDAADYKPRAGIPGLNFVKSAEPLVPLGKAKSKKSKSKAAKAAEDSTPVVSTPGKGGQASANAAGAASKPPSNVQTDPNKRLRNLKKRLKEIEELEKKIASGELSSPEKEQLEKLNRKEEVVDEMEDLEQLIAKLGV